MELIRALAVMSEPPGPEHVAVAEALDLAPVPDQALYAKIFLFQLYPYGSVYLGPEGMMGGEARSRIGGFWSAVGRTPPSEPDHLGALLGLYAGLSAEAAQGQGAPSRLARRAAAALLHEHLASWCFVYLSRVGELDGGAYGRWAALLREALMDRMQEEGRPDALPVHLRDAPGLADPRTYGGSSFLDSLLAPVRAGFILTRADLVALARDLELGLRMGERRYVLEHLLGLEPRAVLHGLASRAERDAEDHLRAEADLGVVARFWAERAAATAELLGELGDRVPPSVPGADPSSVIQQPTSS